MFSYRHAFHAGNHADVLKHTVLIATLQYLLQKDAALTVLDTHAGAGLYRLDGDYANKSGESADGIMRLAQAKEAELAPVLQAYLATVRSFNQGAQLRNYPGSPFIIQSLLRVQERDKLKVFELHPTDMRSLVGNIAQLEAGRQVAVLHEDGFEGIKKFLPPPSRRALVLCDPSYELKSDYAKVLDMAADSLKRFATGTYAVWYPIIPRPEAHDLPRRLKTMTTKAGKSWLHVELTVKSNKTSERGGLPASGKNTWVAAHHGDLPVVSFDDARTELGLRHGQNEGAAAHHAVDKAKALLRAGQPFVWNATHLSRQMRGKTVDLCLAYGARVELVHLEASRPTLLARNRARDTTLTNAALLGLLQRWDVPLPTEAHALSLLVNEG
ncbi:MAG TPA: hypothetical protein DDZ62_14915 [Delftia acidovorans]|nr:hypothetical protein [Delftia acidovorans]